MNISHKVEVREWKTYLLLLLCSLICYTIFLWHQFGHLNTLLSSITLDSIKNYYTFVYHAAADKSALKFGGMNYPFGEHVVYTDCQPLISTLLSYLPFSTDSLIGILHFLLYGSFVVAPLFLYAVLRKLNLARTNAFLSALAIALLSPQFLKINAGHHALAYGCLIPWSLLLIIKQQQEQKKTTSLKLSIFNTAVFFIHPYLGFCLSLFSLIALGFYAVREPELFRRLSYYLQVFFSSIFPIVFFKLFMKLSDEHENRPQEPFGLDVMVENTGSLLSPEFGPFKDFLSSIFPERSQHFEGHSYLGFFVILLSLACLLLLPFYLRRIRMPKGLLSILVSSLVLLGISFGYHHKLLQSMGINSPSVNQFRAVCRFAWVFYFVLPLTLVILLDRLLPLLFKVEKNKSLVIRLMLVLFLTSNFVEAGALINLNSAAFWKFRNFFNSDLLTKEEKEILEFIKKDSSQAILPLPLFHGGSEMYDRLGSSNSMAPAMLYSYHARLPIIGIMASRGSRTETEATISLLNPYQKTQAIKKKLSKQNVFVIQTKDPLLPDEVRLTKKLKYFNESDSLKFALISPKNIFQAEISENSTLLQHASRTEELIYLPTGDQQPFIESSIKDMKMITVIDSNEIKDGLYILSFHYHFKPRSYRDIALDLIITEALRGEYQWRDLLPIRCMSGFYNSYAVFETFVKINPHARYEFILSGKEDRNYHISNFLLRPADKDVRIVIPQGDTLYNNFAP